MMNKSKLNKHIKTQVVIFTSLISISSLLTPISVEAEEETYKVNVGDTIHSIARQHGRNIEDILSINQLHSADSIQIGQELSLGTKGSHPRVKSEFIETIGKSASNIAKENGLYASVMVAQAILESNYGQSALASAPYYNLFGVKGSYQGNSVVLTTNEFLSGQWIRESETFRSYPGYYSSLLNNAKVLRRGNSWSSDYYHGAWIENTNHYTDATAWLENRYATDPNYASKLNRIIRRYDLTKYDTEKTVNVVESSSLKAVTTLTKTSVAGHEVKRGDTLFNIASRYGMSVSTLKNLNHLRGNRIRIGQILEVNGDQVSTASSNLHTVSAGDTFYNIAKRYGMSVHQLKTLNGKRSNHITVGEQLSVKRSQTSSAYAIHTVQEGDTLFNIAQRHQTSVHELKRKNNLTSNAIQIGQQLNY